MKPHIALLAGHSKESAGASNGRYGVFEWNYNDELVKKIYKLMPLDKVRVSHFQRPRGKSYRESMSRLEVIFQQELVTWGFEFHCNGATTPHASGHEVLYCDAENKLFSNSLVAQAARKIAVVLRGLFANRPRANEGIKPIFEGERGYHFLKIRSARCLIIEPAFISNDDEVSLLIAKQDAYAEAMAQILVEIAIQEAI